MSVFNLASQRICLPFERKTGRSKEEEILKHRQKNSKKWFFQAKIVRTPTVHSQVECQARTLLLYIWQCVCVCVCMCLCYRRLHLWSYGAEIWHRAGMPPREGLAKIWAGRTPPPGRGRPKSASGGPCSPNCAFLGKLYKTKVEEHPRYSGGGSGQVQDLTQGSRSQSKCKGMVYCHGHWADGAKTWLVCYPHPLAWLQREMRVSPEGWTTRTA